MPVVSNTSPILNLAIIDRLSLLREQFGEIYIPSAVLEELREKAGFYVGAEILADLIRESGESPDNSG
jgi:predicted nucleic acid-binding protein